MATSVNAYWNIRFPTTGGKLLWTDVKIVNGWRVQKNLLTGHCRLLNPQKVRYDWGSFNTCSNKLAKYTQINQRKKTVVLVHGLGLRKESLQCLVPILEKEGFQTIQFGYSAMLEPLEDCATKLNSVLKDYHADISFVTHSMGGILLRVYQQKYNTSIRKAVMLAPPNNGAKIVDTLKKMKLHGILGINGKRLHSDCDGLPISLPSPNCPYITIAGTKRSSLGYFPFYFKGDNDGIIRSSTISLGDELYQVNAPAYHLKIMKNDMVQKAIIEFLNK